MNPPDEETRLKVLADLVKDLVEVLGEAYGLDCDDPAAIRKAAEAAAPLLLAGYDPNHPAFFTQKTNR